MGIGRTTSNKQTSEPRKRLTKLRSVKVASLDRSRLSLKRNKSGSTKKLIVDEDSLQTSNQAQDHTGKLRASPNYMKATSCSYAKRGSLQPKPGDGSTEIGSAKPLKRIYSWKRSRKMPTTRSRSRLSSSTTSKPEANIQLSRSGSIKLNRIKSVKLSRKHWSKSRFDRASIFMTDDGQAPGEVSSEDIMRDSQADDMEVASPHSARRRWSESRFDQSSIFMTDDDQADDMEEKPINGSEDAPIQKPTRTLWNNRILMKKQSECHEVGNAQFEVLDSTAQVCTYKYCSIHGNVNASSPPIHSFVSYKRRSLKKQKSSSRKHKSKTEATSSSNKTKKVQIQEANVDDSMATDIPLDKQKYTMWKLIYTHFLEHGNELTDKGYEKGGDEENPYTRNKVAESEKPELNEAEAIDFVQQAVDGILLLDEQLSFENAEACRNTRESFERPLLDTKEGDIQQQHAQYMPLREVIGTPKLFKAMEKLRPQHLSAEVHSGEETALLRHLSMNKRKDSEEWRLDNALQQVISKLDPAQQNRVSLLVDVFERVTQDTSDHASSSSSRGAIVNGGTNSRELKIDNPHPRQNLTRSKKNELKQADAVQLVQEAIGQFLGPIGKAETSSKTSKTYNKLWKMVGSTNFIKAMDKRKRSGGSKESVYLRHLSMDQRKTREEWLHDYALQEAITKLAPAQQQKTVAMLARAFDSLSSEPQQGRSKKCTKENEHHKSDVVDDQVLSMIEDTLEFQQDSRSENFETEFDMDLYDDNSELTGVNLHIHDQGGTKGCPVCYPQILTSR